MMQPKAPYADCDNCPLRSRPCAKTTGPSNAKIAVVSRSPGYHEAVAGKPFAGPSGAVLDYFLKQNGYSRGDILLTNTVLCSPNAGKVPKEAIKACSKRLEHEIRESDLVIAAGAEACNSILGRISIDRARGYRHTVSNGNGKQQTVVVTNNPAVVLRDDSTFPNLQKDFRLALNPKPAIPFPEVEVLTSERSVNAAVRDTLRRGTFTSGDLETRGGITHKARIVTFQWSFDPSHVLLIGEREFGDGGDKIAAMVRPILESKDINWIWHNGKYDTKILRYGYNINARVDEDTMLLSHALDERPGVHALEYMCMDELGWPDYEPQQVKDFKKDGVVRDYDELYTYAGYDAGGTRRLFDMLKVRAENDEVWDLYKNRIYIPASEVLTQMELEGARYDWRRAADLYEREVEPELNSLIEKGRHTVGMPLLNLRSTKAIPVLFYDEWGIQHPQQQRPDKSRSVDAAAREAILDEEFTTKHERMARSKVDIADSKHLRYNIILPFVETLHRYKTLDKQASQYIKSLSIEAYKDEDSKVYTELKLPGTESGRLSSAGPNLQNITRPKADLPNIRDLFFAPEGWSIVNADLSQAELRTIAKLSGDRELLAIYQNTGRSLHREMAREFYGEGYTGEQYVLSKNINFGVAYLQGAFSFSRMYKMPQSDAQRFINKWWARFPTVKAWTEDTKKEVHKVGTIVSAFGRKRRFYLITDENKDHAYKEAINFKAQSVASDITLRGAIVQSREIDPRRARPMFTVHDSIVGIVEDEYIGEYCRITKEVMESRPGEELGWNDIPFLAEFSVGPTWGTTKEYEVAA